VYYRGLRDWRLPPHVRENRRIGDDEIRVEEHKEDTIAKLPLPPGERGERFYVVGGPVQPRRGCYIERAADRQLVEKLREGEYCHVLAPPQTGKSSLVARSARELRKQGYLTAVVDLGQTVGRDGDSEAGRWYYGIAYRIVRDLRLAVDLQHWWQEKKPLSPLQRLNEFFWEIVLANTRSPVIIFLDEIESVADLDFAADLFIAVRACHDARAAEPDYERLRFALFGTALPIDSAALSGLSLFDVGRRIDLNDFTFEEARPLCREIGMEPGDAERALYRVFYWTGGHPYLTQKMCRAMARVPRSVHSDEEVDEFVSSRFLAGNAPHNEPNLRRTRSLVGKRHALSHAALRLYRRVRRGRKVRYDRHNSEHEWLRVTGLVSVNAAGRLQVRNRIYAQVFTRRWVTQTVPFDWQRTGKIAATLLLVIGLPYWYTQLLPSSYIEKLSSSAVAYADAAEAYRGLRRLPGFVGRADDLFGVVLERQSRSAESWDDALAVDVQLRALGGNEERADELLAGFWERQVAAARADEMRDRALIYQLRTLERSTPLREGRAAALVGEDYPLLVSGIRPGSHIDGLGIDAAGAAVVTLTDSHIVQTWDASTGQPLGAPGGFPALAEEFVTIRRRVNVETPGPVRGPAVSVDLRHPQATDVRLRLIAPSGKTVILPIRRQLRDPETTYAFDSGAAPELEGLRGETAQGTWTLEVEDQLTGTTGFLDGWRLVLSKAAGHAVEDVPGNAILVADPRPTSEVEVALSPDGRRAASVSANEDSHGFLQVWDTGSGTVTARIPVEPGPRELAFDVEGQFLITTESGQPGRLSVWRAASGQQLLSVQADDGFRTAPALSTTGSVMAVAEVVPEVDSRIRFIDLATGQEWRPLGITGEVTGLSLGPEGRLLATMGREQVVSVWDTTTRTLIAQLGHDRRVRRILFDPSGRFLATVEDGRNARVWAIGAENTEGQTGARLIVSRDCWDPLSLTFSDDGATLLMRGRGRTFELLSLPSGMPAVSALRHSGDWHPDDADLSEGRPVSRAFSATGGRVVTGRGGAMARVWRLEHSPSGGEAAEVAQARIFAVSPTRDQLIAGGSDGTIRFLDRGEPWNPPEDADTGHAGAITALAFSEDGNRLISVGDDGSVLLWDPVARRLVGQRFHHGSGRVEAVAIAVGNHRVLTGGELGARAWNAQTGEPGPVFGPGRAIAAVAFTRAGSRAVTAGREGLVQIWDAGVGDLVWSGNMPGPVTAMTVSDDGRHVAASNAAGQLYVWDTTRPIGGRSLVVVNGWITSLAFGGQGDSLYVQTGEWMHVLSLDESARITASALLPGSVPAGAWQAPDEAGGELRLLTVDANGHRLVRMNLIAPASSRIEDHALRSIDRWLDVLKLRFDATGVLVPVVSAENSPEVEIVPPPQSVGAAEPTDR
jgi:WD40 repeat protein